MPTYHNNIHGASETPGEGAVVIVEIGDNDGDNGGSRCQYDDDLLLFCQNLSGVRMSIWGSSDIWIPGVD